MAQKTEQEQFEKLNTARNMAAADLGELEEQLAKLEKLKKSIESRYPHQIGLVEKLFLYLFAGFFDIIIDVVLSLAAFALSWNGVGEAIEIFRDILDLWVAIIFLIIIGIPFAIKMVRISFSNISSSEKMQLSIMYFSTLVWQVVYILAGTVIEIIPLLDILPLWIYTAYKIIGLQNDLHKKVQDHYAETIRKINKAEQEIMQEIVRSQS